MSYEARERARARLQAKPHATPKSERPTLSELWQIANAAGRRRDEQPARPVVPTSVDPLQNLRTMAEAGRRQLAQIDAAPDAYHPTDLASLRALLYASASSLSALDEEIAAFQREIPSPAAVAAMDKLRGDWRRSLAGIVGAHVTQIRPRGHTR